MSEVDKVRIKYVIEKELVKFNSELSNDINVDDIKEYIKYLTEIYKTADKKDFDKKAKDKTNIDKNFVLSSVKNSFLQNVTRIKSNSNLKSKEKLSTKEFKKLIGQGRTDFTAYNLSKVEFAGIYIKNFNLEGTGAKIDPQKLLYKSVRKANLKGLDLSEADFTCVNIEETNLEQTGAKVINAKKAVFNRPEDVFTDIILNGALEENEAKVMINRNETDFTEWMLESKKKR